MFQEDVASYRVYELRARFDAESLAAARGEAARAGLLLLGELHNRPETPRVIYTLMRKLDFRGLALEWEAELRPLVDAYLATGADATAALSDDGRITPGHFALLRRLRLEGRLERLILLDETTRDWEGRWADRDAGMARSLLRERDLANPALVVVGEAHTALVPQPDGHPLGALLAETISDVPVAVIRYAAHPGPSPIARFSRDADGRYVLALEEHHPSKPASAS